MRVAAFFALLMATVWGCGDGGDASNEGSAGPGESCLKSAECRAPLGCFAGVCATEPPELTKTGKVCKLVDCVVADDCCKITASGAQCQAWKDACQQGDQRQCDSYGRSCTCDHWECNAGTCESKDPCSTSTDSCGPTRYCNGTKCVDCLMDAQCPADARCVNQKCERTCKSNRDCDYLFECQSGACVKVGCKTDRECIALEANERAVCHAGQCTLPCETSEECRSADFPLTLMACIGKVCVDAGCESDQECRIRMNQDADASTAKNAVCVPSTP